MAINDGKNMKWFVTLDVDVEQFIDSATIEQLPTIKELVDKRLAELSPPKPPAPIVSPSQRFSKDVVTGIITDAKTKLEWLLCADLDIDAAAADAFVKSTIVRLGFGWRLPTCKELAALYEKGSGPRNIDPIFGITGWWLWSEQIDAFTSSNFRLHGGFSRTSQRDEDKNARVMAVRVKPVPASTPAPTTAPTVASLAPEVKK